MASQIGKMLKELEAFPGGGVEVIQHHYHGLLSSKMNTTNRIPFLDLVAPHEELKEELCAVFETALKTGGFIGGPMVEAFERDFAGFCDRKLLSLGFQPVKGLGEPEEVFALAEGPAS